jgi:hypothetical protein
MAPCVDDQGEDMKKPVLLTILTAATLTMASLCVAADAVPGAKLDTGDARVLGESLDSGLGELASTYDASEYNQPRVLGEKLDSGLGALSFNDVMGYALSLPVRAESASAPQAAPSVSPRE